MCLRPETSIREVLEALGRNTCGIALLVDDQRRLIETVTDGDLRRAILNGARLVDPISSALPGRASGPAVTAPVDAPTRELARAMSSAGVRHLPLVESDGRVADLLLTEDLLSRADGSARALIMAGGFGQRLQPLTRDTPKPMLQVGDRPILERTIERIRDAGIGRISISTHYMPERIFEYFGDGSQHGVEITYINEAEPLGTAGSLRMLESDDTPIVVINGDVVTELDFRALLDFHLEHRAVMTVAVRKYAVEVPYGVMDVSGPIVTSVTEKPSFSFFVNAGIYVVDPLALPHVPEGSSDMPELIQALLNERLVVISFPVIEYWLDVGHPIDYERAVAEHRV